MSHKRIKKYTSKRAQPLGSTSVRLTRRGEQHPYVIEVITPGWRGCDHIDGTIKQTMPADLREITEILDNAGVRYCSPFEPEREGIIVFGNDGATEFVLRDASDMESAIRVLTRAGWLSPEVPPDAAIH